LADAGRAARVVLEAGRPCSSRDRAAGSFGKTKRFGPSGRSEVTREIRESKLTTLASLLY
jgi:hypothetical protein